MMASDSLARVGASSTLLQIGSELFKTSSHFFPLQESGDKGNLTQSNFDGMAPFISCQQGSSSFPMNTIFGSLCSKMNLVVDSFRLGNKATVTQSAIQMAISQMMNSAQFLEMTAILDPFFTFFLMYPAMSATSIKEKGKTGSIATASKMYLERNRSETRTSLVVNLLKGILHNALCHSWLCQIHITTMAFDMTVELLEQKFFGFKGRIVVIGHGELESAIDLLFQYFFMRMKNL